MNNHPLNKVIEDVYSLFDENNEIEITDKWCNDLGHNIAKMLKNRLQEERIEGKLRLSSIGSGDRKLWYSVRPEIPKEKLQSATYIKFLFGDMIELFMIALIELAGHTVKDEQHEVELEGIKGHIDGTINGHLVDIKSASSFSFKKFKDGNLHTNDPFGYYAQIAAYAAALNQKPEGWLVMDKQHGHLCFAECHDSYLPDIRQRVKYVKQMIEQEHEPAPCAYPVPEGKSGNMKLDTICSYCQFKAHCWRDANNGHGLRKFVYSHGPIYLTHIARLPKVPEVSIEEA